MRLLQGEQIIFPEMAESPSPFALFSHSKQIVPLELQSVQVDPRVEEHNSHLFSIDLNAPELQELQNT